MNRCRTCKHWYEAQRASASERDDKGRACTKIVGDFSEGFTDKISDWINDDFFYGLEVGPNFGCVHHEPPSDEYISERIRLENELIEENERKQRAHERRLNARANYRLSLLDLNKALVQYYIPTIKYELEQGALVSDVFDSLKDPNGEKLEGEVIKFLKYKAGLTTVSKGRRVKEEHVRAKKWSDDDGH